MKRGGERKLGRNQGRHSENKQKLPVSWGNSFLFLEENKKENKRTKQRTKKGWFRAKWGGPSGHLTWPLNPKKQRRKN